MGFFDRAIAGFDRGVQLGARTEEKRQYREQREKERKEDIELRNRERKEDIDIKERHRREDQLTKEADNERAQKQTDIENTRAGLKLSTELAEKQKKEQFEKIAKQFNAIRQLHEGGAADEDVLPLVQKLYTEHWPDGVAAQFHTKKTAPPELLQTWSQDPENSKGEILMLANRAADGKGRAVGFSSTDKLLKFLAGGLSQDKYLEETKKVEQSVATANAAAKPYQVKDGEGLKWVVDVYEATPGGIVRKKDLPVPYMGNAPASEIEKKVADTKAAIALGGETPPANVASIVAGVRKAPGDDEDTTVVIPEGGTLVKKKTGAVVAKGTPKQHKTELGGGNKKMTPAVVEAYYNKLDKELRDEVGDPKPGYEQYLDNIPAYRALDLDWVAKGKNPKNMENIAQALAKGKTAKKETTTAAPTTAAQKADELEAEMKRRGFVKGADGRWGKPATKLAQNTTKKALGSTRSF